MTRALRGNHDDVDAFRSLDIAIVDVEAMSKRERVTRMEVRRNVLLVRLGLDLIGDKDHDHIGFF